MKRISLSFTLPAAIVALGLVIAIATAFTSVLGARHTLLRESEDALSDIVQQRGDALEEWFAKVVADVTEEAGRERTAKAFQAMHSGWRALGDKASDEVRRLYITENTVYEDQRQLLANARDGGFYSAVHATNHPYFSGFAGLGGYYDVFMIDADGNVIYTVFKEDDFGTNLRSGTYAQSGLAKVFEAAVGAGPGEVVFADFAPYAASGGEQASFAATRVVDAAGQTIGVLAVQLPLDQVLSLTSGSAGLGETGEFFSLAQDGTRRNSPRFEDGSALGQPVPATDYIGAALRGESGTATDAVSHNGKPVVVSYGTIDILGTTWAAVAQKDLAEVTAPLNIMIRDISFVILGASVVILLAGTLLGRWVATPLRRLSLAMSGVASRTFTDPIPASKRRDEIGGIAQTLGEFREKLTEADKAALEVTYKSQAFTGSSVAMMIADPDGKIIYSNTEAGEMFSRLGDEIRTALPHFDPEKLLGTNFKVFHKNNDRIQAILRDPSKLPFRSDISIGNAKFALNATAATDDAGTYIGNIIEFADVADARMNEGILSAIRRNQMVVEMDLEGRILAVNDVFTSVFGYSSAEVTGRPYGMLVPGGEKAFADTLAKLKAGAFINDKARRSGKNGAEVWVESSLNAIADRSGRVFKLIEIAADVTQSEREMIAAQARREELEAQQQAVVNALRDGVSRLANGDLSRSLEKAFPAEYEGLRTDFNSAVSQLRDVVSMVVETSGNIRSGASEISQAADDLSRRTESQAATLEETAAAMDELTHSVKSGSEGAADADRVVKDALDRAEASGVVVVDAVNAMSEIEKSSQQISQIIGVIDDIAFQTNLLALNAGVEAARAGEAGRGFAVVASEVRALAQRSSEAAKEIKQLISMSSRHVENGVGLVGQAGEALKTIVSCVSEISGLVSDFASSSKEQAVGLTEINSGVTMLDQVTQQNAAMVEQSTAASHLLRQEAETLGELVARFKLGQGGGNTVRLDSRRVPPAAAAEPAPQKRRAASAGTDWQKDSAVDSADGWESF